jgi:hypothetical protein
MWMEIIFSIYRKEGVYSFLVVPKDAQSIEFFTLINGMWLGTNGGMCKKKKKNLAVTLECTLYYYCRFCMAALLAPAFLGLRTCKTGY